MALAILRNGVPLDSIYSAKGPSTAAATGCLQNGVDVNQYLLALADGSALGYNSGISKNGTDFSAIFGVGTPRLGLPNGVSVGSGRTGSTATVTYKSDGTWAITTSGSGATYDPTGAATTGTWFSFGGIISDYTVSMVGTGFVSGPDPGGGTDSYSTTCATVQALTSNQSCTASAVAGAVGNNADNNGFWTIKLYKSGVLVAQNSFYMDLTSAG